MGIDRGVSYENIQFLTLFYSSACMVVGYRLLKILGCKRWGLVLPMAILCFHPTFIIMAGSINNDLLSITLALYGVYAAVRWYKDPTLYHIITVALGVGLSMMTKLSGGLVAPGIAVLFLAKWPASAVDKKQFARLFWQFGVFALICIPVALWWPVKNAVLYQVPITFVPSLSENSGQYLGQYTTAQRLFELPKESFSQIFMAWQNQTAAVPYNEYNLFLSLMKTSVFGEFTLFTPHLFPNTWQHLWGVAASKTLFWSNILLAILSLYAGVLCLVRCRKRIVPWALLAIWVVVTFGYVRFCFAYPQACTQNFRYAVPTLMCGLAALGGWTSHCTKTFKILVAMATGVFCLASTATYGLLGTIG